jgi:hypothetical protein
MELEELEQINQIIMVKEKWKENKVVKKKLILKF